MSGDCIYFQSLIKELNPADTHSGDCCTWEMVACDGNNYIEKIDLSNFSITTSGAFPQTVAFFSHLKEFSIRGQQNINDIYSLNTENLEKVDLSNSGMSSANFPLWLYEAKKLREIDISNTKMVGLPQREFGSSLSGCNFSNTPICGSYESSPYKGNIPEACIQSCTSGGAVATNNSSNNSSSGNKNNNGGTKVWPFILIGVIALLVLGALGFLFMKKKGKKSTVYEEYENNKPAPISKKNEKVEVEEEEEPLEITVEDEHKPQTISPFVSSGPPTPASDLDNNRRMEEEAINNYNNAYGGDARNSAINENRISGASAKEIYRQHNGNVSYDQDNLQTHPSIYNTMTTDNDSDEEQDGNFINQPIVSAVNSNQENTPTLLRRQSSKRQNVKTTVDAQEYEPIEEAQEEQQCELYIANWDYAPTLSDELALVAGDVIEITKKFDDGWCNGYNRRTNQSGIVPLCYLKEYED